MAINYTLPVRISQALLAVTVLGLTGYGMRFPLRLMVA